MAYQRFEILTGSERQRNYTPTEKARIVEDAFGPGVIMKEAVRRLGSHTRLLYCWRRLMMTASPAGGLSIFVPVTILLKPGMTDPSALPPPPTIVGVA
jgi:transposase